MVLSLYHLSRCVCYSALSPCSLCLEGLLIQRCYYPTNYGGFITHQLAIFRGEESVPSREFVKMGEKNNFLFFPVIDK